MASRRRRITRRVLLAAGGLAGCCVVAGGGTIGYSFYNLKPKSNVGKQSFSTPLTIPPLLEGDLDADRRRVFDLTLITGTTRIMPDGAAETWGINGPLLGPTLRARQGEVVAPLVHNNLPEDSTLHWHGMHLPATMDGGPHQMISTGETWSPSWTVENPASTLWYHPHPHGQTAEHVYRGVAGLFLIDDDLADGVGLPQEYGVDDIPLILQDRNFTDDGELDLGEPSFIASLSGAGNYGLLGDTMLVNGTCGAYFDVTRSLTRFRILNGSNARFYNLGFNDDRPFQLVATDNGLVSGAPVELTRLQVGPGERVEIVVAFKPGDDVTLRSFKQDLQRQIGGDDTFDLIALRASSTLTTSRPLPDELGPSGSAPTVPEGARARWFRLDGHTKINDFEMDMARIDEIIPVNALEVWYVESSGEPHTFHIHGTTFHVLAVNGRAPDGYLRGPKDTVRVDPDHRVTLAVQFGGHPDPNSPYMYHCHLLRHEDNGMMGQFVIVDPGTEDTAPRTIGIDMPH